MSAIEESIRSIQSLADANVLVAVSGGVDSMVLLNVLRDHKIVVAHFNHQLRLEAAHSDCQFVKEAAANLGAAFVTERWEQDQDAIRLHGIERAARDARLGFLARAAADHDCKWIAMAHHADDQVETFFWRLLRGAGGRGLGGMETIVPFPGQPQLEIVRPFLRLQKSEILSHAKANQISFREDESNADPAHLRNRIRNRLLPLLREDFHPQTNSAVTQSMDLVKSDAACVSMMASKWLEERGLQPFEELHVAMQRQVIWLQLVSLGIEPKLKLIECLRLERDKPVAVDATYSVRRDSAGQLQTTQNHSCAFDANSNEWELNPGWNECLFGQTRLRCRAIDDQEWRGQSGVEFFDADRVGPSVTLRHWHAGDRFQPIGLGAAAKLQNLFTNAKVPPNERRERIVACTSGGEIFWVQGLRIGEIAKIRSETRRFLEWQCVPVHLS